MVVKVDHVKHREWMVGASYIRETKIQRSISVVLAPNRSITNSIDFPTKDARQHPSGLEYLWLPDVHGFLLTCLFKVCPQIRDKDNHSS